MLIPQGQKWKKQKANKLQVAGVGTILGQANRDATSLIKSKSREQRIRK